MHGHRAPLRSASLLLAALLAPLLAACGSSGGGSSKLAVEAYVAAVKSFDGNLTATAHPGSPPVASAVAGEPQALVVALTSSTYLRGGTSAISVSGTATRAIVAIEGIDGYWELTGLTPGTSQTILVTFGQSGPASFTMRIGGGSATAIVSYESFPVTLTEVGTGQVQVNVTWDLDVDVNLHVRDPLGNEIYYDNLSAGGGALDLDSNPGCALDHKRAENITWASGTAPAGTYQVLVDYYEACVAGTVNYVVTVNVAGKAPQTFARSFTDGAEDFGNACFPATGSTLACGVLIGTFSVP